MCWESVRQEAGDSFHVVNRERTVAKYQVGQLGGPADPYPLQLQRFGEDGPLGVDEAQGRVDRNRVIVQHSSHGVDLPLEAVDGLGAVATADVQPEVGLEEAADVAFLDLSGVLLGVDDPYAARRDREVIDVAAGLGDLAVVQQHGVLREALPEHLERLGAVLGVFDLETGRGVLRETLTQDLPNADLPVGALRPCRRGLWIVRKELGYPAEPTGSPRLLDLPLTLGVPTFELLASRGARGSGIDRRWVDERNHWFRWWSGYWWRVGDGR